MGRTETPSDRAGCFFGHKETWMAPVARAPQDPHPPTTCLCPDRKVKSGKVGYRDCTRRKQEREERHALVVGILLVASN